MSNYSKNEVILVNYPFSDLSVSKVRPAIVVSAKHTSKDIFIVPLTSKIETLLSGEFILTEWEEAGLNVSTAVKRGIYTIKGSLILKSIGKISESDATNLQNALKKWLGIK
jgi:mRNA interferase MazF